jgi:hypothetical protein
MTSRTRSRQAGHARGVSPDVWRRGLTGACVPSLTRQRIARRTIMEISADVDSGDEERGQGQGGEGEVGLASATEEEKARDPSGCLKADDPSTVFAPKAAANCG